MLELNATLIAVILNFVILLWILNRFLYKPVLAMLDSRKKAVEDMADAAKKKEEEAENLRVSYEQKIASAAQEGRYIIENAQKYSEAVKKDALESARLESIQINKRALDDAEKIKTDALLKIKITVASLSILVAEKILKRNITELDQKQFVDDFVDNFDYTSLN